MNKRNEIDTIKKIFSITRTIAVVGLSPDPEKPSHYVPSYLQQHGFKIIPVYPKTANKILNERVYKDLKDIPLNIDTVLIFRRAEYVLPHIEDAIKIKAKAVWLQDGIINYEARELAENNGLLFIMDRCMYVEHRKLN